jgi:tripeptidyl-peptidase-1
VAVGGAGTWPNACSLAGCKGLITPAVLKQRYSVPDDSTGMEAPANAMAVAEFQGQYFKKTDMQAFSTACKVNVSVDTVVGGDSQSAGVEAELDIEFIRGVSDGIPLTVIYSAQFSLLNWMTQVSKMTNPPQIHSVSYGNDEKQQTSTAYMFQCNVQFMKAGAQGISVLFASGDQGVCGREGCGFFKKRFKPDFPAGSPYITGVGGTDFVTDSIGDETAWSASGGGFSDTFGIPTWQADAVKAYKANPDAKLPAQSMWNNTGRGYPDISALGGQKTPYCVVVNGGAEGVAGTSASSPTASSVFARVNGVRLKAGKPVLGFLNPFIYQNSAAFNDVTSGCNTGGGSGSNCFTATKGWDPATGWGTPNFKALSAAAMAMFE